MMICGALTNRTRSTSSLCSEFSRVLWSDGIAATANNRVARRAQTMLARFEKILSRVFRDVISNVGLEFERADGVGQRFPPS